MKSNSLYDKYIGQHFGRLVALKDVGMKRRRENSPKKTHFFLFRCDCGKEKEIAMPDVLNGKICSCGCFREEEQHKKPGRKEGNPKHGDFYKKIYKVYHNMRGKCLNPNSNKYENFGGRGITICNEWLNDYIAFRDWSLSHGYDETDKSTLCRKDLDKGFSPDNCFYETLSFSRKHSMSVCSRKKMIERANKWREDNRDTFVKAIRKGITTKIKKYGIIPLNNREKATWKCGWRTIAGLKIYFRSRWEANYGRYLQKLKEIGKIGDWVHEPKTFLFPDGKTFLPDFEVIKLDGSVEYHEVKGWNDERSKHHLQAMKENFPNEKLIVIFAKQYNAIKKEYSKNIPEWEK